MESPGDSVNSPFVEQERRRERQSQNNENPGSMTQQAENGNSALNRQKRIGKNPTRKRHGARNQNRHKNFVKWLVEIFDLIPSNDHDGSDESTPIILDVAGGKGEVSARLCMCHRQMVVMVDPRPADLPHCFETLVYPKIPNKWQQRLDEQRTQNPDFIAETLSSRFHQLVTTFDENSVETCSELQSSLENAKLILGLHADGATEAIVDVALKRGKPFCVVPCCVFPNLFTSRRVENENGEMVPVRSHEQFCKYLAAKDERFKMEELPFEGRNLAIYWNGK